MTGAVSRSDVAPRELRAAHEVFASEAPVNAMSVDVEDYFQVSAFAPYIQRDDWEDIAPRVEANTERVLGLFEHAGIKATFFTLGWVAERFPGLVRAIVAAGHEIASHGYAHVRVSDQDRLTFRGDIVRTKALLEDVAGVPVTGYRAASYSIGASNLWALDELQRAGYRYSSSIYPIRHDHYGMPDAPRFACRRDGLELLEVPITTVQVGDRRYPCGGGGWFRLAPYALSRWALRRVNADDRQPAVFYFHPWEVDPDQPRVAGIDARTRFRHYLNLGRMERRLAALLGDFRWDRMDRIFGADTGTVAGRADAGARGHREHVVMGAVERAPPTVPTGDTAASVTVRPAQAGDAARWDAFVQASPEATFFHRYGWREVIESAFGHRTCFLLAESAGQVAGVLPLAHVRSRLFANALISTPFCVYGGVVAGSDVARKALETAACEQAAALGVDYLEMRNMAPSRADWLRKDLYVTFRKAIDPDPEVNLKAVPRKQRAMIRKGIKAGLAADIDSATDRLYHCYSESVRNLGTPVVGKRYFDVLARVFADDCQILTVTHGGQAVSSVMSFFFRDEVLPYYGGGTAAARGLYANDYMYWEVMRRACQAGARSFDYGRSKVDTGSYRFKKHWGFEPEPLAYEYHLVKADGMPNLSPTNPKYRLFIDVWKRLPVGVTRLIGPLLARNLG